MMVPISWSNGQASLPIGGRWKLWKVVLKGENKSLAYDLKWFVFVPCLYFLRSNQEVTNLLHQMLPSMMFCLHHEPWNKSTKVPCLTLPSHRPQSIFLLSFDFLKCSTPVMNALSSMIDNIFWLLFIAGEVFKMENCLYCKLKSWKIHGTLFLWKDLQIMVMLSSVSAWNFCKWVGGKFVTKITDNIVVKSKSWVLKKRFWFVGLALAIKIVTGSFPTLNLFSDKLGSCVSKYELFLCCIVKYGEVQLMIQWTIFSS